MVNLSDPETFCKKVQLFIDCQINRQYVDLTYHTDKQAGVLYNALYNQPALKHLILTVFSLLNVC